MSVSAPAVTAPLLVDGGFDGSAIVANIAGICPGATIVAQSSTQPDKVGLVLSCSGDKVLCTTQDGTKPLDLSNYRVNDGAQLFEPAQTVAAIPSLAAQTIAGNSSVGGNSAITGNETVGGTLGVTGAATLSSTLGVTGLATLTGGISLPTGANIALATSGAGTKIGTATTQLLGFWNASPVAQYSTTGTSTGFTAGAGTAVLDDSTFTGNTGSKAYRISDIVRALKLAGIMAAS